MEGHPGRGGHAVWVTWSTDPADADVAVVRLPAPFEPRDDLFLEGFFHQGSLDVPARAWSPGCASSPRPSPLVIDPNLERPAILTPFTEFAAAILTDVGAPPRPWSMC